MSKQPVIKLLSQWPDRKAIHADASVHDPELDIIAVHRWFARKSVPARHWLGLIEGAKRRNLPVSAADLVKAHSHKNNSENGDPVIEVRHAR